MPRKYGPCMCGKSDIVRIAFAGLRRKIENRCTATASGCWLWKLGVDTNGYPQLRVVGTLVKVSRIAYEVYKGPIPKGLSVCHTCDVRRCVNPEHLWVGTTKDNALDMVAKGRAYSGDLKGEKNGNAKMTSKDILRIRESPLRASIIAPKFNTSAKNIRRIRSGQRWSHLPFDRNYLAEEDK